MNTKVVLVVAAFCLLQGVAPLPNFVDVVSEYKTQINELTKNVQTVTADKKSNLLSAVQDVENLASQLTVHIEHQIKSLTTENKIFDSCIATKNAAIKNINSIDITTCRSLPKWEKVNRDIASIKDIESSIKNFSGKCIAAPEVTSDSVRACFEESLGKYAQQLERKGQTITQGTFTQKQLATDCMTASKDEVDGIVAEALSEYNSCKGGADKESYLDVVAEFKPKLEELAQTLVNAVDEQTSKMSSSASAMNNEISQAELFLKHQLDSLASPTEASAVKKFDACIASHNKAVETATSLNFNTCKATVSWDSVKDKLNVLKQLKSQAQKISEVCVSRSSVNLEFLKSCIGESITDITNKFTALNDEITGIVTAQQVIVSLCLTSTKVKVTKYVEDIIADYNLCVEERESLDYNTIIAAATADIETIGANIASIEKEAEQKLEEAESLIELYFQTNSIQVTKQLEQLQEVAKARDSKNCKQQQQMALEKVPINALEVCKVIPTANLNKVQPKLQQLKEIESVVAKVPRTCAGAENIRAPGEANVDITLSSLNSCIKSSLKEATDQVVAISSEVFETIEESVNAARTCGSTNKNTIITSLKTIINEYTRCIQNRKEDYLDVVSEFTPQIEELHEKLVDAVNVQKSNVQLAAIDFTNLVSQADLFLAHQLSSVASITEGISHKKVDACVVNHKKSLEEAENFNFNTCKSAADFESLSRNLNILTQLEAQAKQISDVCVSRSSVNLEYLRSCIKDSLTNIENKFTSLIDEINGSIAQQKLVVSMCITSTKIRITKYAEDILAEYTLCVNENQDLKYQAIIEAAETEINMIKSNIAATETDAENKLKMANSLIEFFYQTSNDHVQKQLEQLQIPSATLHNQKCIQNKQIALEKVPINALNSCKVIPTLNLNKVQSKLEEIKETEAAITNVVRACLGSDKSYGLGQVKIDITLSSLNNCIRSSLEKVSEKVNSLSNEVLEIIDESVEAASTCATTNKNMIVSALNEISEEFNTCSNEINTDVPSLREEVSLLKQKVAAMVKAKSSSLDLATSQANKELSEAVLTLKQKINSFVAVTQGLHSSEKKIDDCLVNHNEALEQAKHFNFGKCVSTTNWESVTEKINSLKNVETEIATMEQVCDVSSKVASLDDCLQNGITAYKARLSSIASEVDVAISTEKLQILTCISSTKNDVTSHIEYATTEYHLCVDESESLSEEQTTAQTLEEVFEELTPKVEETNKIVSDILVKSSDLITELHKHINTVVSSSAVKVNSMFTSLVQTKEAKPVIGCTQQREIALNKLDGTSLQLCRIQDQKLSSIGQTLGQIAEVKAKIGLSFGLCAETYKMRANDVKSCIENYLDNAISFANNYHGEIQSQVNGASFITNICVSNQTGQLTRAYDEIATNYSKCVSSN